MIESNVAFSESELKLSRRSGFESKSVGASLLRIARNTSEGDGAVGSR